MKLIFWYWNQVIKTVIIQRYSERKPYTVMQALFKEVGFSLQSGSSIHGRCCALLPTMKMTGNISMENRYSTLMTIASLRNIFSNLTKLQWQDTIGISTEDALRSLSVAPCRRTAIRLPAFRHQMPLPAVAAALTFSPTPQSYQSTTSEWPHVLTPSHSALLTSDLWPMPLLQRAKPEQRAVHPAAQRYRHPDHTHCAQQLQHLGR